MKKNLNIEKSVFLPTIAIFLLAGIIMILGGEEIYLFLSALLGMITRKFGWAYIWIYVANFIFLGWLAFGKYGNIKFGKADEKPEFSNFNWICMVFTTGIDASIMIMSMIEPIQYLKTPPFGITPFSDQAYDYAHMYGQFHWGPSAWMMYIPATIAVAYTLYIKKADTTRISNACIGSSDDGKNKKWVKSLIDTFIVIAIMGGIGASIGLEIPVISKLVSVLTGLEYNNWMNMGMLLILLVIFGSTVYLGLDKGIQVLSSINVYVVLGILVFMLFSGPTQYILDSQTNSVGLLAKEFVRMSTYTDPNTMSGFPQNWTIFYWGWWLAYMPVMGLFVARISRGRTIRQVITGQVLWGSLGCMSFFMVMGGYSLFLQKSGAIDLAMILDTQGQEAMVSAVVGSLPLSTIMLAIYCAACFIFLATTISSSAFILSSMTSKKLTGYEQPNRWNRMIWSVVIIIFSAGIIMVGGFSTIQVVCVIAGFPLIGVCILLMRSIHKMVKGKQVEQVGDKQVGDSSQ